MLRNVTEIHVMTSFTETKGPFIMTHMKVLGLESKNLEQSAWIQFKSDR